MIALERGSGTAFVAEMGGKSGVGAAPTPPPFSGARSAYSVVQNVVSVL